MPEFPHNVQGSRYIIHQRSWPAKRLDNLVEAGRLALVWAVPNQTYSVILEYLRMPGMVPRELVEAAQVGLESFPHVRDVAPPAPEVRQELIFRSPGSVAMIGIQYDLL